jgi:methionyl-tRNA formyltransferase
MTGLRIIFMGTPDFAAPSLVKLAREDHVIPLVATQPDRPKGRGRKLAAPPVKIAAQQLGLSVDQTPNIRNAEFILRIAALEPDVLAVVAFGQILSPELLKVPRLGAVNVHPSLLPRYRGPAPIPWAILNGETETGVTIMQLDPGMDSGPILMVEREPIFPDDTAASLHDRLSGKGANLLARVLKLLASGPVAATPQNHNQATYAPFLNKKDGRIDWNYTATRLDSFIRGMNPWPGAYTFHREQRIIIFRGIPASLSTPASPGTVIPGFENELRVATGGGQALSITEIQGASGKKMAIRDYLRGNPVPAGAVFE